MPTISRWLREGSHRLACVGDRLVLADRRLPGRPAARQQRRHARLPLVGEGPQKAIVTNHVHDAAEIERRVLQRPRPAARGRRQPREHPLRRRAALAADDEHRARPQPHRADRPGLLRLLRPPVRGAAHALHVDRRDRRSSAATRPSRCAATCEPRIHRSWFYALARAWATVIQLDLQVAAVIADLYAGRPVVYTTFLAYDEVAHHSGVERRDTLAVLRKVDRQLEPDRARRRGRPAAVPVRRALRPRPVAGRDVPAALRRVARGVRDAPLRAGVDARRSPRRPTPAATSSTPS